MAVRLRQAALSAAPAPAAAAEPAASELLWRAFETLLPDRLPQQDCATALRAGAAADACVCRADLTHRRCDPWEHVRRGYSQPSQWLSASSQLSAALAFACWMHAKCGPTPAQSRVGAGGEVREHPFPARPAREGWVAKEAPAVVGLSRRALAATCRLVSLDTGEGRKSAGAREAAMSRRAAALHEVLIGGIVRRGHVREVLVADFTRPYGRRLQRFTQDYFGMVKLGGESAPGCYHAWYRAVQAEFAAEGAVFGADGGLMLPPVLVEELRANARARGWVACR